MNSYCDSLDLTLYILTSVTPLPRKLHPRLAHHDLMREVPYLKAHFLNRLKRVFASHFFSYTENFLIRHESVSIE